MGPGSDEVLAALLVYTRALEKQMKDCEEARWLTAV